MNTKHTPRVVDYSDSKKAIKALAGSADDAFTLINQLFQSLNTTAKTQAQTSNGSTSIIIKQQTSSSTPPTSLNVTFQITQHWRFREDSTPQLYLEYSSTGSAPWTIVNTWFLSA